MKVCIIGTGYVGLSIGVCLSEIGHNVICVDNDIKKIDNIKKGDIPVFEPKIEDFINQNTKNNRLSFTTNLNQALSEADVCFISVGTPPLENGDVDTSYVDEVIKNIAKSLKKYTVIVNKSTVPIGSAQKTKEIISSITNVEFDVVSNPEFLRQGNAVDDFLKPERIVIGSKSKRAIDLMLELYKPLNVSKDKILIMDEQSAEMVKYAANSFLAVKISYINEIANLCEKINADINSVKSGLSLDPRIGKDFLNPGVGFGGSCFPKDTKAIINIAKRNEIDLKIINSALKVNQNQKNNFIKKILKHFNYDIKNRTFALWGLSFKPNTNDTREAPSIEIVKALKENGAKIKAYDPKVKIFKNVEIQKTKEETLINADALILLTEWDEFKNPDFNQISKNLKEKVIFDGRNQYFDKNLEKYGLQYICVGKNEQKH